MLLLWFFLTETTAKDIIAKADEIMRGTSQAGRYTMVIVHPKWERELSFEFWAEGTDKSFIHILSPKKERHITFLKKDREMWQYIPKVNRTIKIPPSMMLQPWMGSDFTNDDLVKESSVVHDYSHELLGKEEKNGFECWKLELIAKPDAPVVWGKIIEWVRDDYLPVQADFYNERGELVRQMVYSHFEEMGGRVIPTRFELTQTKKPGRKTILVTEEMAFDIDIEQVVFSQSNLTKAR